MHTPPPFNPNQSAPKSSSGKVVLGVIAAVVIVICGGLIFAAVMAKNFIGDQVFPMAACMVDMQSVGKASAEYAKEHGGKLPAAANWQADLRPYVEAYRKKLEEKDEDMGPIKLMDLNGVWGCGGTTPTAFTLNDEVAGKIREDLLKGGKDAVMFFETTNLVKNAHGPYVKPDNKKVPRMTGWLSVTVNGDMKSSIDKKGKNINMQMD